MMIKDITQAKLKEITHYDPFTWVFVWLAKISRKNKIGAVIGGTRSDGYKSCRILGKQYLVHRLLFLYMTGAFPVGQVDHIDCDKGNNRWINLRDSTATENSCNTRLRSDNTSGIKGVSLHKKTGMWTVHLYIDGKDTNLGYYRDKQLAKQAIYIARELHHGIFARHQ